MPAFVPWILGILAGVIATILKNPEPLANPVVVPEPVTPPTPTNPPPPPKNDKPVVVLPPPPNNPFTDKPDPKGKPFPKPPKRRLPDKIDLGQKEHPITSSAKYNISNRIYGCLLYSPIVSTTYTYCEADPTEFWTELETQQETALKRFTSWVIKESDILLDKLDDFPILKDILASIGLSGGIEQWLEDRLCDLALTGISIYVKGLNKNVIARTAFIYGCEALVNIAIHYTKRNDAVLKGFPLILDSYINFQKGTCDGTDDKDSMKSLPDSFTFKQEACCEPSTVLMPDPAAFTVKGHILVLFWVLEDKPDYKTYYTTTQVNNPIDELVNVVDDDGKLLDSCKSNWATYFKNINRTQGYQHSRTYCNELKAPFADGFFKDKQDAQQYFDSIYNLSKYTVRERAPVIHSSATEDEYLKKLSHVGKKLILKKVNVVKKDAWTDDANILISYRAKLVTKPD